MELLLVLLIAPVVFALWVLVHAFLFRVIAGWVADHDVSWGRAAITVVVAGVVQTFAMGAAGGLDGGCFGTVFGFLVWSAVVSMVADLPFARAMIVGLCMAAVTWLLGVGLALLVMFTGAAALLGIAGILAVG